MYSPDEIINIFKEKEVLLSGHFLLTSGRHAANYMQCAKLLQYPDIAGKLCSQLAGYFADSGVSVVAGPATGAIIIAYEVARALGVRSIFTERENGIMSLRRGFNVSADDKVLVVEDVITTGGSVREVIDLMREKGASVVGAGVWVDRSAGKIDFGVPLRSLISLEIESFDPQECPLCKEGKIPVIKPGSRNNR